MVKNPPANAEDMGLVPGSGSSPGVGWQLTPVFLLGEFHKQRRLVGYSPVQFSRSVIWDSLRPHGLQHARLPCPSLSPGVCSNSCSELVMPSYHLILSCPLLLPPSISPSIRVFQMSQLFESGGQSIAVSAPTSALPKKSQG